MRGKKKRRGVLFAVLLFCMAGLSLYTGYAVVMAAFQEEEAVHIEDPAAIENATLLIGTHLIYLGSVNEVLYQIAMESASDAGQSGIYYKSELADGAWFDITEASSVAEISTQGVRVSDEEIRALFVTHHTKSDKITYDLRTNQAVCIFDISSVYELERMKELEPLKMQYDLMKESGSDSATARRNLRFVRNFFAGNVHTEETNRCDLGLAALQQYYEQLAGGQAQQKEIDTVVSVMEKLSNARKVTVFTIVNAALEELQLQVQDAGSVEWGEESIQYDMDDVLLTAIGDSMSAVMESMTEAEGNLLEDGERILTKTEYTLSMDLTAHAAEDDFAACDADNGKLGSFKNISSGVIADREAELALADEMIAGADEAYRVKLAQGVSADYQAKEEQKSSHAVLDAIKSQDIAAVNAARSELQFLIQARVMRQEAAEGEDYILGRIESAGGFRNKIKEDAYAEDMRDTVAAYVRWLEDQLEEIKSAGADLSEEDLLREQKAALQEKKMAALDQEDLDTARKIDAQIERLDQQILEQSPYASDADAAENILGLKADAMDRLLEKAADSAAISALEAAVSGLEGFLDTGSPLALESMKEIYQKMAANAYLYDTKAYDGLMASIEESIANSDVTELVTDGGISADMAISVIEEYFGGTLPFSDSGTQGGDGQTGGGTQGGGGQTGDGTQREDGQTGGGTQGGGTQREDGQTGGGTQEGGGQTGDMQPDDMAAALLALAEYADHTGSRKLASLAAGLAASAGTREGANVFQSEMEGGEAYIPADVLAEYTGFGYIWNDTKKTAVLSKGRTFYRFTAFSSEVGRESGKQESMETPARFHGTVYLPASYVQDTFLCEAAVVIGTEYSVLVNDYVMQISQELLERLQKKGGENWEPQ